MVSVTFRPVAFSRRVTSGPRPGSSSTGRWWGSCSPSAERRPPLHAPRAGNSRPARRDTRRSSEWLPTGVLRVCGGLYRPRPRTPRAMWKFPAGVVSHPPAHPLPSGTHTPPACEGGRWPEEGGRRVRRVVVGMALLVGFAAVDARAQGWSAMSGQTLGSGGGMVWGQLAGRASPRIWRRGEPHRPPGGRFAFNTARRGSPTPACSD